MILKILIVLALYGILFTISEAAYRRNFPAMYSRKIVHIGSGIISSILPLLIDLTSTLVLGAGFTVLLIWAAKQNLLNSIHTINGRSSGTVLFPIGLMLCAGMFWNIDPSIYQISALILGLSDGLAGIVGNRYGRSSYNITGIKTFIGSLTFFAVTLIIMLSAVVYYLRSVDLTIICIIVLSSLILTAVEGLLGKGWDNLILPPASGFLLYFIYSTS